MQNPRCYEPHFQKSLMLLDPTWIIPGPRSLVQLDVHKLCHPAEAPGDMYSLPTPRHHHMAIKSEYVGTEVRKQGILRIDRLCISILVFLHLKLANNA